MSQGTGVSRTPVPLRRPPLGTRLQPGSSPPSRDVLGRGMSWLPRLPSYGVRRSCASRGWCPAPSGRGRWRQVAQRGTSLSGWGGFLRRVLKNGGTRDLGQNLKSDGVFAIHHGHSAWSCSVPIALLRLPPGTFPPHHMGTPQLVGKLVPTETSSYLQNLAHGQPRGCSSGRSHHPTS